MGIWDFINSSTEAVKRNAPDPVKSACRTSYNYGIAACRTSYGYGSAACTKIDHIVRVNGHQMLNQWLPDDEAKSKISIFATKFAKNAALYAVHECPKFVPGGATVSNIVSKTIKEVERETLNEKPKPLEDGGSAPGKGFKYQKPMEDGGSAPSKGFEYQKLMDRDEMQPGSLDRVNVDSVDNRNPDDVRQIFRARSWDDLMMPLLGKGEETSLEMAPVFSLFDQINASSTSWSFKARVVRQWETPSSFNGNSDVVSLDMVLTDRQGMCIQATVRKNLLDKFRFKISEGCLYVMRHFIVAPSNLKYKTTTHSFRLYFMPKTTVVEVEDNGFPKDIYRFRPFPQILSSPDVDEYELFDVIGEVVCKDAIRTQDCSGRTSKLIDVVLEDLDKNRVSVTLWGDHVDQVNKYLESDNFEPVVVLLQMCRSKKYKGEIRINSTFYHTKLIVNEQILEIIEFRNKLLVGKECASQRISQISGSSIYFVDDDLQRDNADVKTIGDILSCDKEGSYWVVASILAIESSDWWYLACRKCSKKLRPIGNKFHCDKCDNYETSGFPRFKIQIRVIDDTSSASFLIWDRECVQLLGKSASELREEFMRESGELSYPLEIEGFVDRFVLFKVTIKNVNVLGNSDILNVIRATENPKLVSKYVSKRLEENKDSIVFSRFGKTVNEDMPNFVSDEEVNAPLKKGSKRSISDEGNENTLDNIKLDGAPDTEHSTNKLRRVIKFEDE